jgi:hypothetical protein
LQQEKDEKENLLEGAVQRMENGLSPTDMADMEFETIEKNKDRRALERDERIQRKLME